jgi:hypothetical protein
MTTKFIVQVDWDRTGKWKNEEDFDHLDEAIEMCQAYDSHNRDPAPLFRVAKVTTEIVWAENTQHIASDAPSVSTSLAHFSGPRGGERDVDMEISRCREVGEANMDRWLDDVLGLPARLRDMRPP